MSLTLAQDRASLSDAARNRNLEQVRLNAEAIFIKSMHGDVARVLIKSELKPRFDQTAADVFLEAMSSTPVRTNSLAAYIADRAQAGDVSAQVLLTLAMKEFGERMALRAEAEMQS